LLHSPTRISSIFRSSVKIKPFVTVLESPRLLVRVPKSSQAFPPQYHAVEFGLTHNENFPILLPTKSEFLSRDVWLCPSR